MSQTREFHIDGHKLVALPLNDKTEGRPIILLHGITHSVQFWSTDEVFRTYGPCYALSLPAHFPAVAPPEFFQSPLTAQKMVSPLAGAIRELAGSQPALLTGLSTGGFAALALAALYPELVAGVVCLAGFAQAAWIANHVPNSQLVMMHGVGHVLFIERPAQYRQVIRAWLTQNM